MRGRTGLAAVVVGVVVMWGSAPAPARTEHLVEMEDQGFIPDRIEVEVGDTVEWRNEGEEPHSVSADDGSFDSSPGCPENCLERGERFSHRFDSPGTFPYRSKAPGDDGMAGVVVVLAADGDGSPGSEGHSEHETGTGDQGGGSSGHQGGPSGNESGPSGNQGGGSSGDQGIGGGWAEDAAASSDASPDVGVRRTRAAITAVAQATASVSVQDDLFVPRTVRVEAGGTVVWQHQGDRPHTVTADDGSFDSGTLDPGETFSQRFSTPGTFAYHCRFHGAAGGQGMAGTVVVTGAEDGAVEPPAGGEEELAVTGFPTPAGVASAVALIGAGVLLVAAGRLRRRRPGWPRHEGSD